MAREIKSLLIGYDGSKCADEAIDDLRRAGLPAEGIEAVVLSVADVWPELPGPDYSKLYPQAAQRARLRAEDSIKEARTFADQGLQRLARHFPGWKSRAEVATDSPYWGLVKTAHERGSDLLVVGSQGRSAPGRMLFGSVSQNAILYARASVRIGRCQADRMLEPGAPVRFLVGWDGSTDAELAVRAAAARHWPQGSIGLIVTALDTRLATALPVVEPKTGTIVPGPVMEDERDRILSRARAAAEELRAGGLSVEEPILRDGDPKHVLLEEADAWKCDCIFVGAKGRSRIERVLLGSVSAAVAARARCSVEVIRG